MSKSRNVKYQIPVEEEDLNEQFGKNRNNSIGNRLTKKILYYTNFHRNLDLDNLRPNKLSAYYWFPRLSFFRNNLFLKFTAHIFDRNRQRVSSVYDEPVKIHENSVFLYKSPETSHFMALRLFDYAALSFLIYGTVITAYPLMWFPCLAYAAEFPKIATALKYYTVRADLLPHTEQVVFTKLGFFGSLKYHIVDIKDLVKVTPDALKGATRLLQSENVDKNFIWKDNASQEVFVFDVNGIWSEEGINHPLIN